MTIGNKVRVNVRKVEVEPLSFLYEGQEGVVVDETQPDYVKVKFSNWKVLWVDKKYLKVIND
jgi:hypothetical protein